MTVWENIHLVFVSTRMDKKCFNPRKSSHSGRVYIASWGPKANFQSCVNLDF